MNLNQISSMRGIILSFMLIYKIFDLEKGNRDQAVSLWLDCSLVKKELEQAKIRHG